MKKKLYLQSFDIPVEEYDISLANRILFWESLWYLNNMNNNYFEIKLERQFYQNIDGLLYFPNTSFYDIGEIPNDSFIIDEKQLPFYIRKEKRLDKNKNYHLKLHGVQTFHHFDIHTPEPRPMFNIKFDDKLYDSIQSVLHKTSLFGIHVRRGDGVNFSDEFYENLSTKAKSFVKKGFYTFYDDSWYHPLIEEIQKINPNQKFYVSHDLTHDDYEYWKKKFGSKNILFNDEFFQDVFDYYKDRPKYVIMAILDMLVLIHCPVKLVNDESTFSLLSAHDPYRLVYDIKHQKDIPGSWKKFLSQYKQYIGEKNLTLTK